MPSLSTKSSQQASRTPAPNHRGRAAIERERHAEATVVDLPFLILPIDADGGDREPADIERGSGGVVHDDLPGRSRGQGR